MRPLVKASCNGPQSSRCMNLREVKVERETEQRWRNHCIIRCLAEAIQHCFMKLKLCFAQRFECLCFFSSLLSSLYSFSLFDWASALKAEAGVKALFTIAIAVHPS